MPPISTLRHLQRTRFGLRLILLKEEAYMVNNSQNLKSLKSMEYQEGLDIESYKIRMVQTVRHPLGIF